MNFWISIFTPFAGIGFVLSLFFLFKKKEHNRLFGFLLFAFAFNLVCNIFYWQAQDPEKYKNYVLTIFLYLIPLSLYGPLFFLYVRNTIQKRLIQSVDLLHLLPMLLTIILHGGFIFLKPASKFKYARDREILDHIIKVPYYEEALVLLTLVYVLVIYYKYKDKYKQDLSLRIWLMSIFVCFLGFTLMYALYEVLVHLSLLRIQDDYLIALAMCLFIFVSAYFAFWQPHIFNGKPIEQIVPFLKYKNSPLPEEHGELMKAKLLAWVEKEKPYLNPDIRLDDLAEQMGMPRNVMSQIINEKLEMNFNKFINKYRLEEAENLLLNQELSIKEILYQSGFNNRTTFFNLFKKKHNLTPSQFRKQMQ